MQYLEDEIRQITEWVWVSTLEREAQPLFDQPFAPAAHSLTGFVRIAGDWEGAVAVQCSSQLARQLAALMFNLEEQDTTPELTQDALGELVNMVGGNVKALLPAPNTLSLPVVTIGGDYSDCLPGNQVVSQVGFEYMGEPFFVTLLQHGMERSH